MHPGRWTTGLWVVLGLLMVGLPEMAGAQTPDEDNVHFLWAFEALVVEGAVTKQVPIKEDITLKTGDQLKMFVELRKPCFVYVLYHGAQGEVQMLFPYTLQQLSMDYSTSKLYAIPPEDAWFRLNEQVGRETFYLIASAQRLTDLEKLIETYAVAPPAEQPQLANAVLTALRTMIRQHRAAVKPGRPVPIAGNMRRGVEGIEVIARDFYSKTFTIDHR